ncbi:MAG TPA: histidine kinase [Acidimicrobiales bacterium]|nr:histidine kinase [Acidimicrobiales bacterium]
MNTTEIRPSRVLAGVVFTLAGIGFLLESLGVWTVDLVYLWPVLLMAIGVSFLLGKARSKRIEEDRTATLAVAEERVRIARELHDIVAHGVSLMTIQIAAARRVASSKPEAADKALAAAEQAGRQSLAELRSLLAVLRSADASLGAAARPDGSSSAAASTVDEVAPTAPLPHLSDIPGLVDNLRAAGLDVALEVTGEPPADVPPGVELASYRVVQESLTNAVRHAPGARVVVDLDYAPDGIDIVVDDDGAGLMATRPTASGHGLMGMRERVATGSGTLEVGPRSTGPGWRVHARFPLGASRSSA